ncbi:MFS transporter [Lentzea sp. NPDC059081]|uniref:MFS transporter n=1 Tax=Lentzea sp. NPDC059081 TaxID=3346719 RepID=UPI0036BC41B8
MSERALRHNRDFRLLWLGQALSALGSTMSSVALPLLVLLITESPVKAGIVALAGNLPFVLLQLPAGAYVDRLDRRAVMLTCDLGRAVAAGSVAVALVLGEVRFAHLVVVAAVDATLAVPFQLAESAALRRIVDDERQLPTAIALNQARTYGTELAGQPLGGLLFGIRNFLPFAAEALAYVGSLLTVLALRTPLPAPSRTEAPHLRREMKEGLVWFWRNRFLRTTALLVSASDFVINGLFLLLVVIAQRRGMSEVEIGLVLALGGAGGVLGSVVAPLVQKRVTSLRLIVAGVAWIGAPAVAALVLATDFVSMGLLLGLTLSVWPVWNAVIMARWLVLIPDELMGRVQSAAVLVAGAPVPLAGLTGAFLYENVGATGALLVFASIMLIVAVFATVNRSVRAASAQDQLVTHHNT